jgi:NADH dehydrogenase [ubiquinone] 1 alpha subcomplex assembly factor 7
MRMCLTSDTGGYYTGAIKEGRDQFGKKGDFITSPEISQIFGELIGIWFVAEWISQGRPRGGVELIEVGPGRGTLMDDMLRVGITIPPCQPSTTDNMQAIENFPDFVSGIDAIYMVEASPELRMAQKNLLCGEDAPMNESKVGYHSTSKFSNLPITWTETIQAVPYGASKTPFIVAHEFFDALPIHAFQVVNIPPEQAECSPTSTASAPQSKPPGASTSTFQWREMVVAPAPPDATHDSLGTSKLERHDGPVPEFQLALSPSPTRHSLYVPESSARYQALKSTPNALIEVCPDAYLYAAEFAARIGGSTQHPKAQASGAALILDYGPSDTIPVNSLRGIKNHKRVSPFSEPGLVDLSVDVDFLAIAEASMMASEGIEVHGPVNQAEFLEAMGIRQRAEHLARKVADGAKKEEMETSWRRLVDRGPNGMGKLYKALAILPENEGRRRPTGFGGDVGA